jgi:hypothetical protein
MVESNPMKPLEALAETPNPTDDPRRYVYIGDAGLAPNDPCAATFPSGVSTTIIKNQHTSRAITVVYRQDVQGVGLFSQPPITLGPGQQYTVGCSWTSGDGIGNHPTTYPLVSASWA